MQRTAIHAVTVTAISALTLRMRRLTLAGPSLVGLAVTPAQDIEIVLPDGSGHQVKRRYTVRHARPDLGEFDVDVLLHPHGPGGRWAGTVAVGDALQFLGPRGHLELRPAGWHLLVGDEASLPAIGSIMDALPGADAIVLAEVGGAADELDLGAATVTWLHRDGEPAGGSELLRTALGALGPRRDGRAYLLGESRAMVALRPSIAALGIAPEHAYVKGYWNVGRAGRRIPA